MCCSPYDYCVPAHINRNDDFRGCGPQYRAGSVFTGGGYGMYETTIRDGNVLYVGNTGDFYSNAGNYGTTTPISTVAPTTQRSSDFLEPPRKPNQSPIAKPQPILEDGDQILEPYRAPNGTVPTVEELLQQPRRGTMPRPMTPVPIIPPAKPRAEIPSFEAVPIETMPFSPNDETTPPDPFPITIEGTDSPITLEELRRLDPSIRDVQIISIEDAAVGTSIY